MQVPEQFAVQPVECITTQSFFTSEDYTIENLTMINSVETTYIAYEFAENGDFFENILKSGSLPLPIVKYYMN